MSNFRFRISASSHQIQRKACAAMSKASELRDMSSEQLELTLKDAAASLFRLRIQAQTERLDAPTERARTGG